MTITVATLGRFLMSLIFFVSGWRKLDDPAAVAEKITRAAASAAWVPDAVAAGVRDAAPVLVWTAILFEVVGAFCLATGLKKEFGAQLLILFLLPTSFLFHPPGDPTQLMSFLKNTALIGGLLLVAAGDPRREDLRT
jgi:uncharacterized membrane protein YphA (DoxX/SURF4 family)